MSDVTDKPDEGSTQKDPQTGQKKAKKSVAEPVEPQGESRNLKPAVDDPVTETRRKMMTDKDKRRPSQITKQKGKQKSAMGDTGKSSHATPVTAVKSKMSVAKRKPAMIWLTAAALLIAVISGGAGILNYQRWEDNTLKEQTLRDTQQRLAGQLDVLEVQLTRLQEQSTQLQQTAASTKARQETLSISLEHVAKKAEAKAKDPIRWRIAEVEYLLKVANHRVLLERDVDTAISALSDADRQLDRIGDPSLIPIRRQIANEKNALNSIPLPDIAGLSVQLSELVQGMGQLPLVTNTRSFNIGDDPRDSKRVKNWRDIPAAIWADIKSLVTVRRSGKPIEPLLPPGERQYLAQNLGLKLEQSRLALLRRDTPVFRSNLKDARDWVDQYFDKDIAAVNNVISAIDKMQQVELQPTLPDISASLRGLRQWLKNKEDKQSNTAGRKQPLDAKTVVTRS